MSLTGIVTKLWLLAAVVVVIAIVLERKLPDASEPLKISDLSKELQDWERGGKYVEVIDGYHMFVREGGKKGGETVILVHGFPTSSYDYARAYKDLEKDFHVVMFDHLGFGFSDKPDRPDYVYSMFEQAENALHLWRKLGIRSAHIISHDMGDSVLTEIVARRQRGMLPEGFPSDFFRSVTFTNGGMRYALANFRLTQSLFKMPYVGAFLSSLRRKLPLEVDRWIFHRQLESIWSKEYADQNQMKQDIEDMQALMRLKGGDRLVHKTMLYLHDRARFEPRWLKALKDSKDLPVMVFWGDSDAVAPKEIAISLADYIKPEAFTGRTMKGAGHFLMLEQPQKWAATISQFVKTHSGKRSSSK